MPAVRKLRPKDLKFKVTLGSVAKPCSKNKFSLRNKVRLEASLGGGRSSVRLTPALELFPPSVSPDGDRQKSGRVWSWSSLGFQTARQEASALATTSALTCVQLLHYHSVLRRAMSHNRLYPLLEN